MTSSGRRKNGADPSLSNLHSLEKLICCAVALASKPSRTATPAAKRETEARGHHITNTSGEQNTMKSPALTKGRLHLLRPASVHGLMRDQIKSEFIYRPMDRIYS